MAIKLAEQVFFCPDRITRVSGWRKELALALGAGRHCRDLALMSQDHEVTLSHDADSLAQFHELRQSARRTSNEALPAFGLSVMVCP
jgi:hypothetical protein